MLISGEGTNLQALIDATRQGITNFAIVAVFSDRSDARGLERARKAGIAARHVDPKDYPRREAFDQALADAIDRFDPGLLVLAGFMRILNPTFVARFADRILNIHPSLLPKFKGLHTHRRALAAAETEHGATVHFVTAELDGGPAVLQYRLDIRDNETEDSLSARVHEGEYIILPRAVSWYAEGRLRLESGRAVLDGDAAQMPVCIEAA